MKNLAYLAIFFVFTSCAKETTYQTPQEVIVAGKILNLESHNNRIHLVVARIGVESLVFEVETDSLGNFATTFETYTPTSVRITFNTDLWVLVHPNDSVFVEFDGKAIERSTILKTVKYSGDTDRLNHEAAKIQELYFSSPLYLDKTKKQDIYMEYDEEQFLQYYDTLTNRYHKLYENYVADYFPSEEGKTWAKNFIDFTLIDELAFYPLNHMMYNQLSQDDWYVSSDFYAPIQDVLPLQSSMFLSGTFLSRYVNRYLYAIVGERTRNEDIVKKYAANDYEGMSRTFSDSIMIAGIIKYTPDELLREMVLTEYLVTTLTSNDITSFENSISIVEEYITDDFLKVPLYEKYHQVKRLNENPLPSADAIIKTPNSNPVDTIMADIRDINSGKVIYLDFWATWCSSCKREMSNSKHLMETMKNRDVAFVFICIDSEERLWTVSLAEFQIGGQHYFLNEEQSDVFRDLFDVNGIPHYFLFDKGGELLEKGSQLRPNTVKEKIEGLL